MVSHLLYYQLALLALVWLFVILHVAGSRRGTLSARPATLIQPKRTRSNEPKAFEGLTQKPHCALCERDTVQPKALPPTRPDPMPPTNRRPREVDTSMHFCPQSDCTYRGWLKLGNLRANGHPNGGPWRQFYCTSCEGYFLETHGTLFHGKQAAVERSCRCWPVWLKDWASAPPRESLRSMPRRCCTGWWKQRSSCGPFLPFPL